MAEVRYSEKLNRILHYIVFEYERIVEEEIEVEDPEEFALFTVWLILALKKSPNSAFLEKALSDNPDNRTKTTPKSNSQMGKQGEANHERR